MIAIVTVAVAVLAHVGVAANKPINHTAINAYILQDQAYDEGPCKGAVDIAAHGTIEWHPLVDVPSQGFSLEVADARAYWKATGNHTVHVWLIGHVKVGGPNGTSKSDRKTIDEWDLTSDNMCCESARWLK